MVGGIYCFLCCVSQEWGHCKYNITEVLVSSALSDLNAQNQHFPQAGFSDDYRMATCSNQDSRILYSDILGDGALSTRFEHKSYG